MSPQKQTRLEVLMAMNNQGDLEKSEWEELAHLVGEVEEMALTNARLLADQHKRLPREIPAEPKVQDASIRTEEA